MIRPIIWVRLCRRVYLANPPGPFSQPPLPRRRASSPALRGPAETGRYLCGTALVGDLACTYILLDACAVGAVLCCAVAALDPAAILPEPVAASRSLQASQVPSQGGISRQFGSVTSGTYPVSSSIQARVTAVVPCTSTPGRRLSLLGLPVASRFCTPSPAV